MYILRKIFNLRSVDIHNKDVKKMTSVIDTAKQLKKIKFIIFCNFHKRVMLRIV